MKIHVTDIDWDTTDEGGNPLPKREVRKLKLPKKVDIEIEDDGRDLDEQICDYLSDEYEFCINSFCYALSDGPTEEEALVEVFNACMAGEGIGAASMGNGCVFIDFNGKTFRVFVEDATDEDQFGQYVNSVEAEVS